MDRSTEEETEHPARMLADRIVFVAVLALPSAFLWAAPRMRTGSPEEIAHVARIVNLVMGAVLGAFSIVALLRKGHGNARLGALGCLAVAVGGLVALREIARRAAVSEALSRAGREFVGGDPALVTPLRIVTIALAAAAGFLFFRAGRSGAWSTTFAFAGAMLSADVALLALFARAALR